MGTSRDHLQPKALLSPPTPRLVPTPTAHMIAHPAAPARADSSQLQAQPSRPHVVCEELNPEVAARGSLRQKQLRFTCIQTHT